MRSAELNSAVPGFPFCAANGTARCNAVRRRTRWRRNVAGFAAVKFFRKSAMYCVANLLGRIFVGALVRATSIQARRHDGASTFFFRPAHEVPIAAPCLCNRALLKRRLDQACLRQPRSALRCSGQARTLRIGAGIFATWPITPLIHAAESVRWRRFLMPGLSAQSGREGSITTIRRSIRHPDEADCLERPSWPCGATRALADQAVVSAWS